MDTDTFDLASLARYLQRDARDLEKMASQGRLPGRRVQGDWRFNRDAVREWLDGELSGFSDVQLAGVEVGLSECRSTKPGIIVSSLLSEETMAVPLMARTASAVIKHLVETANGSWQIYSPEIILAAVREREDMFSTALPGGVAIPHPRRPLPETIGDSVIAFGRTLTPIAFGGPRGQLTDLFFLVLCQDERTHLQVLARLARMFQREQFLDRLREAPDVASAYALILATEEEILG